ncbi:MAG: hypothetical protein ACK4NC_06545 [Candidatus Gracilibacteria bacterium]
MNNRINNSSSADFELSDMVEKMSMHQQEYFLALHENDPITEIDDPDNTGMPSYRFDLTKLKLEDAVGSLICIYNQDKKKYESAYIGRTLQEHNTINAVAFHDKRVPHKEPKEILTYHGLHVYLAKINATADNTKVEIKEKIKTALSSTKDSVNILS